MNTVDVYIRDCAFVATATRALFWPEERLLVVSDLHMGKSERIARRSGQLLPPYETRDTIGRLADVVSYFNPKVVVCLGDSFDDIEAGQNMSGDAVQHINVLMAGRDWIWIEGNHDPGPVEIGGTHLAQTQIGDVVFRHIAEGPSESVEISGHYHPKARIPVKGRTTTRPCFLYDQTRLIMPSFGTYTGGLYSTDVALTDLMGQDARAVLTGVAAHTIPMPR